MSMNPDSPFRVVGKGVYSLAEASRLTRIPPRRIRRWLEGYSFISSGKKRRSPAVLVPLLGRGAGTLALSFSDLIEVRFLDSFIEHGVSWKTVRAAAVAARELVKSSHPFSSRKFMTDGRDILAVIADSTGKSELLNLAKDQWEFEQVITPLLYVGLEFNREGVTERWWPMKGKRMVVIDPRRAFGAPIVDIGGVQTRVLASSAAAEGSQRRTAELYSVTPRAVRDAVAFENILAAA